ncbi:MAG: 2-C-methyl-D-erythritol 2,4-cyclodiphosphate synthase [Acidobacteria bacterium]|nr:MAG: 2-C-methyl-D-erythritol 2,4-cyclodiphosphate synthase [Acidobacteriota bacterium]
MTFFRVGQGFDVHRFRAGRPLILCGETLPADFGLDGHSDADVVLHATTDAILGAVGAGDIGQHFPPSDPRWKNVESKVFLDHALKLAQERGLRPVNCDVTLVGERPRIGPHRDRLRAALAAMLHLEPEDVNIKATTTEGLGWTGRGEGLACMVVLMMEGGRTDD